MTARGKLEKVQGGSYRITEIVVKPRVVLASANDLARMPRIFEKAKENCFISNSIKSAITVEPEVFHDQVPARPVRWADLKLLPPSIRNEGREGLSPIFHQAVCRDPPLSLTRNELVLLALPRNQREFIQYESISSCT